MVSWVKPFIGYIVPIVVLIGLGSLFSYYAGNYYETTECNIWGLYGPRSNSYDCGVYNYDPWTMGFWYSPPDYNCPQDYSKCGEYIEIDNIVQQYENVTQVNCYYLKDADVCQAYIDIPEHGGFIVGATVSFTVAAFLLFVMCFHLGCGDYDCQFSCCKRGKVDKEIDMLGSNGYAYGSSSTISASLTDSS
jgi:hypothetical protein